MITCRYCLKFKPERDFFSILKDIGTCNSCRIKQQQRLNYLKNQYPTKNDVWIRDRSKYFRNRDYVYDYLKTHPCVDCGESDIIVLQFDHNDDVNKVGSISKLIRKRMSQASLVQEIQKCTVRCANCHTRRTAKQFNWSKLTI